MTHQLQLFFGPIFNLAGSNTGTAATNQMISTQGITVSQNVADFTIVSTVASFNGGVVNGVLSGATGGSVSHSAASYSARVNTRVSVFTLPIHSRCKTAGRRHLFAGLPGHRATGTLPGGPRQCSPRRSRHKARR
jgi:hypothetical protein